MNLQQTGELAHKAAAVQWVINIIVIITTAYGNKVSFKTGWMTYPDGHIILTTPFGGRA